MVKFPSRDWAMEAWYGKPHLIMAGGKWYRCDEGRAAFRQMQLWNKVFRQ